uniref:Uncharacterized protein n=1 Tax=Arundo donax TaxID=35708 RepID=A0A0A9BWQ4_ARUDO
MPTRSGESFASPPPASTGQEMFPIEKTYFSSIEQVFVQELLLEISEKREGRRRLQGALGGRWLRGAPGGQRLRGAR